MKQWIIAFVLPFMVGTQIQSGFFKNLTNKGGSFLDPLKKKGEEILKPVTTGIEQVKGTVQQGIVAFDQLTGEQLRKQFSNHPYGKMTATARVGTALSNEEIQYLQSRMPRVKGALQNFLGMQLQDSEVPRIAFCGSGGGYRAMLNTLGVLIGAQNIGLLDGATYLAGLSGSTWAIAPWMYFGNTLEALRSRLIQQLNKDFFKAPLNLLSLSQYLLAKVAFKQPVSTVDVYGALLAANLLGGQDPNKISLPDQIARVNQGAVPLPIYTAIVTKQPYEWIEFTPYEVGSTYLRSFVPSWAFGRKFLNGTSTDFAPPLSLGFLMGIWGSAFAANFKEILTEFTSKLQPPFLRDAILSGTEETTIGRQRLLPAKAYNYTYGMPSSPRTKEELFSLVDAGIDFNLPLPPLMRKERAVDLIIVLDASADGIITGKELKKAEEYFKRQGIKIPAINYEGIGTRPCSVFRDESDKTVPTIMYMPQVKNPKYSTTFDPAGCLSNFCGTFNFVYKPEQVNQLTGLSQFNMQDCKQTVVDTLKKIVEAKRKK